MEITSLVPVTSGRLVLRQFDPEDLEDLYAYQGLSSVARYLYRRPHTREDCEKVIAERVSSTTWVKDGDKVALAICRHEQRRVMGEVTLTLASAHARQAEIGWMLNPEYEKRGYATEAARAVAALAFDVLGVHRLFARLDAENTDSVRVCERLGMRREAYLVENDLDGERWGSEYIYAALAHDLKR
ncbi:GNAT family N-acetyltransferase [Streptomyces sp. NPDC046931]|uniref:GNAT family N-acetyltransferase n=1 Tax=Streptomyces sp. NPDC046931 TaxID=3154806 RepID=UPI0033DBDB29